MSDRRRAPRYSLSRTTTAEINLLQDVSIQSAVGDDVIVLAAKFPANCDRLMVQMVGANGEVTSLSAAVVTTAPVLDAGAVRFRLELRIEGFARCFGLDSLTGVRMTVDAKELNVPATLVRQYSGRLLDISSTGCLVEIAASLIPGAVGRLEAVIEGRLYAEAVRVARVDAVPQGGATHVGLEFLLVSPAVDGSIRAAMLRLTQGPDAVIKFIH